MAHDERVPGCLVLPVLQRHQHVSGVFVLDHGAGGAEEEAEPEAAGEDPVREPQGGTGAGEETRIHFPQLQAQDDGAGQREDHLEERIPSQQAT